MYESDALKERMVMTKTELFLILQIIDNCSLIKIKSSTSSFYFDKGASGRFDFYQTVTITAIIKIKKRGGGRHFFWYK